MKFTAYSLLALAAMVSAMPAGPMDGPKGGNAFGHGNGGSAPAGGNGHAGGDATAVHGQGQGQGGGYPHFTLSGHQKRHILYDDGTVETFGVEKREPCHWMFASGITEEGPKVGSRKLEVGECTYVSV
jgi:hypothetical protein